jgi:hypothetical protein
MNFIFQREACFTENIRNVNTRKPGTCVTIRCTNFMNFQVIKTWILTINAYIYIFLVMFHSARGNGIQLPTAYQLMGNIKNLPDHRRVLTETCRANSVNT